MRLRWIVLVTMLPCAAANPARAQAPQSAEKTALDEGDEPSPAELPPTRVVATAPSTLPRERGFVLECGLDLRLASTPLEPSSQPLAGSVFAGWKRGRTIVGLGLQLAAVHNTNTVGGASSSGTIVTVLLSPGVRTTVLRGAGDRFELAVETDLGIGRTFGDTGPGADTLLGLPPGTAVLGEIVRLAFSAGPVARYWVHPQLALESLVLGRVDFVVFESFLPESRRFQIDLDVVLGLRLLAVF
jgi:hypothetical protein